MPVIAFYTFGLLHEPPGHPRVRRFEERTDSVFERAKNAPGFIHLVETEETDVPRCVSAPGDFPADTLSVWQDLASVAAFAYRDLHAAALRQRRDWFRKIDLPGYVAWWIEDGQVPTWAEGATRYEYLCDHGSTPFAFDFKQPFTPAGEPASSPHEHLRKPPVN